MIVRDDRPYCDHVLYEDQYFRQVNDTDATTKKGYRTVANRVIST